MDGDDCPPAGDAPAPDGPVAARVGRTLGTFARRSSPWDVVVVVVGLAGFPYVLSLGGRWAAAWFVVVVVDTLALSFARRALSAARNALGELSAALDRERAATRYSLTFNSAEDMLTCVRALESGPFQVTREDGTPTAARIVSEMLDQAAKDGLR